MALHVPRAPGIQQMLKDGARMYTGMEEAVVRNIHACKEFAETVRSAYGPNGMNKMVINHIEKQFVTSDAATIIRELDIEHPAAKLIVMASKMQEAEVGDATNFVIIFAGALLEASEELIRLGITASEVAEGYEKALQKCIELLPSLVCYEVKDYRDLASIKSGIRTSVMSKQYGQEDLLSDLIAKACASVMPEKTTFNVDNIRVCKILGSGLARSEVVQGMVFKRLVEGTITKAEKAKVAIFSCPIDIMQTETKGTVLIKTAAELRDFSKGEECMLEGQIKAIADTGAKIIVAGAKFGDMALHFINKHGMMAVRLNSKFDLRRLAKTVNATVIPRMIPPSAEELGYCDICTTEEIGDTLVVVFKLLGQESRISTIVVRGPTDNFMDDIERAIDDGVNTFKGITRDGRFVPGAGATEVELAKQLSEYADTLPGLEQYAVRKFAQALEAFPKALADNSGVSGNEMLTKLYEAHAAKNKTHGVDIESTDTTKVCDTVEHGLLDLYLAKHWGIKHAVEATCTILRVDHIIMAKRAGGPKPKAGGADSDEE
uniref:T-complex protein 1 subunit theta n=1 Tax=Xenopsylla cheopis TaxID=163159 RepID=A0A6M2DG42_XENCH